MKKIVLNCWANTCWFQLAKKTEKLKQMIEDNNVEYLSKHYILEDKGVIEKTTLEFHTISHINFLYDLDDEKLIKVDYNNLMENVDDYFNNVIPNSAGYFSIYETKKEDVKFVIPGDVSDFSPNDIKLIKTSFCGRDIISADVISYKGQLIKAEPNIKKGGWYTQIDGYILNNNKIEWPKSLYM